MDVRFNNKHLLKLYETGKSKKIPLSKQNIIIFIQVVNILDASEDIYDLWNHPSLKFEKLRGYEKRYSVRLDRKYRLEMEIDWINEEMTVGLIGLEDISNHYAGGRK